MRPRLFGRGARRLRVRRDMAVRRLDAVQASVASAASVFSEAERQQEHPAVQTAPGALAQHIVDEFGWLTEVLQWIPADGVVQRGDAARFRPAADHLGLAVRNILDRQGRPEADAAPLIDVVEAVATHLEAHIRSLASTAPLQDA